MSLRCLGALAQRAGVRARFHNSTACRAMSSYQLLSYEYVHDILEKRGPHRDAHLTAAKEKARAKASLRRATHACLHCPDGACVATQFGLPQARPLKSVLFIATHACTAIVSRARGALQAQEGKLVLAGATGDPTSGAVFIWKDTTAEARICRPVALLHSCMSIGEADKPRLRACSQAVKAFVHADPYTKAGLIDKWCEALPPLVAGCLLRLLCA